MKVNKEISPMKDYLININNPNSYPDIIGQVDKVINKYKSQLEQLKPKKDLNELKFLNIHHLKRKTINIVNLQK